MQHHMTESYLLISRLSVLGDIFSCIAFPYVRLSRLQCLRRYICVSSHFILASKCPNTVYTLISFFETQFFAFSAYFFRFPSNSMLTSVCLSLCLSFCAVLFRCILLIPLFSVLFMHIGHSDLRLLQCVICVAVWWTTISPSTKRLVQRSLCAISMLWN